MIPPSCGVRPSTSPGGCRPRTRPRSISPTPTRRRHEKLVDRLLASGDYADYFANKWGAVLRNRRSSDKDDPKPTAAFHAWIRDSLDKNKPYDQFVREILTAEGELDASPTLVWYREVKEPTAQMEDVAQLFLGQRIQCARCHHHPLEKWSQQDYYALAAFFVRVEVKDPTPVKKKKGEPDVAGPTVPCHLEARQGRDDAPAHEPAGAGLPASAARNWTSRRTPTLGRSWWTG